jgi:hypothetical protein
MHCSLPLVFFFFFFLFRLGIHFLGLDRGTLLICCRISSFILKAR